MDAQMSFQDFAKAPTPPAGAGPALQALWHEVRGDWDRAHELAQQDAGRNGAWVHAYLHRKEGDLDNARYWYQRAGRAIATSSLATEWRALVEELLRSTP